MNTPAQIPALIARNALFTVNHSGGKDSQAMLIAILKVIPRQQILVVHASLGTVEWPGALELAQQQAADAGVAFRVARAVHADGSEKTFLSMVERRFASRPEVPSFPSPQQRTCTSDLKRGPIEKVIKAYMKEHGFTIVVNCEGIRAAESDDRAKYCPWVHHNADLNSKGKVKCDLALAGREAYGWLPIFELQTLDVWCVIRGAGQQPHAAYRNGNERLSCVFCIMGSRNDLINGIKARPELAARYVELEQKTGYAMFMRGSLTDLIAQVAAESQQEAA